VRYIGNRSTGRLGTAIAVELLQHGAAVTFVFGTGSRTPDPTLPNITLDEIETIFPVVEAYLETYKNTLTQYPLLVNPYAFMLAIRMCEQGRAGCEFGVMAEGAWNTDLKTQAEWAMATLVKDTKRWHTNTLATGKDRKEYKDFIDYFGSKWAPIGAENDPYGLNQNWIPNFQKYYALFLP